MEAGKWVILEPYIAADNVNVPTLSERLNRFLVDNVIDEDGDIHVRDALGFSMWIKHAGSARWLQFYSFFRIDVPFEQRVSFANRLNQKARFAQFSTPEDAQVINGHGAFCFDETLSMKVAVRAAREFAIEMRIAMETPFLDSMCLKSKEKSESIH